MNATGLATLTIPACVIAGRVLREELIPPFTTPVPVICSCLLVAVMVKVTGCPVVLCAVAQVACQVPSFSRLKASGGSPVEKLTVTFPAVCGLPQSSTDCTAERHGPAFGVNGKRLAERGQGGDQFRWNARQPRRPHLGRRLPVFDPEAAAW